MDIVQKIDELREERGWSINTLAAESQLTQSTLSSMLGRHSAPKIDTLQCICNAFGMTLAQFFLEDESIEILTDNETALLAAYRKLPEVKQKALFDLIND